MVRLIRHHIITGKVVVMIELEDLDKLQFVVLELVQKLNKQNAPCQCARFLRWMYVAQVESHPFFSRVYLFLISCRIRILRMNLNFNMFTL